MNDGDMANSDIIAHNTGEIVRQVQDGVVLDIRMVSDDNAVEVPPEHGVAPDAGVLTERDVAQHHRAPSDINAFAQGWASSEETCRVAVSLTHSGTTVQFEFYSKRSIYKVDNYS